MVSIFEQTAAPSIIKVLLMLEFFITENVEFKSELAVSLKTFVYEIAKLVQYTFYPSLKLKLFLSYKIVGV